MPLKRKFINLLEKTCEKCGNDEIDNDVRYVSAPTILWINNCKKIINDEGFIVFCKQCTYEWFVKCD